MIPNLQGGSRFNFGNFMSPGAGSTAMPARPGFGALPPRPIAPIARPVSGMPAAPVRNPIMMQPRPVGPAGPIAQPVMQGGGMPYRGTAMPAAPTTPTFNPSQFLGGGMAGPYQPFGAPGRRPMPY